MTADHNSCFRRSTTYRHTSLLMFIRARRADAEAFCGTREDRRYTTRYESDPFSLVRDINTAFPRHLTPTFLSSKINASRIPNSSPPEHQSLKGNLLQYSPDDSRNGHFKQFITSPDQYRFHTSIMTPMPSMFGWGSSSQAGGGSPVNEMIDDAGYGSSAESGEGEAVEKC